MSTHQYQLIATGLLLEFKLANCQQWGYNCEGVTLTLPLSASQLIIVGMHEGTTKQVVSYSQTNRKWVGENKDYAIWYIAITRS